GLAVPLNVKRISATNARVRRVPGVRVCPSFPPPGRRRMGLASQVARTALKLPLRRPASCQNADTSGNLGQIVVELVIAAEEPMNDRAGYRPFIKIDMRKRRSVVLAAVIEIDRRLWRQSSAEICRWRDVFTRPAARANKGRRDEKNAGKL